MPQAVDGLGEWVELYNPSLSPVSLSGWSLRDQAGSELGSMSAEDIASGGHTVVHFTTKLNNDGDTVTLYDSGGSIVDTFEYKSAVPGKSFARVPDGGEWAPEPVDPTGGAPNGPCDTRGVVINEVMPRPLSGSDWAELFNVGCVDVDLSGWTLADKAGYKKAWDATVLPARLRLVAYFSNRLNNDGDSLELVDAAGAAVDSFSYTSSVPGKSWQRAPGGGPWGSVPGAPSRGSPNPLTTTAAPLPQGVPGGPPPCGGQCSGICYGTWNIQNLGISKGGRPAVMSVIRQVLSRYDVVGIQELSQKPAAPFAWCGENTGGVICDSIPDPETFAVQASPRIGDEQYVVMYKKAVADVPDVGMTYPDDGNVHSRPPHAFHVHTKRGNVGNLVVGVTHTRPEGATEEIHNFPHVTSWMKGAFSDAHHFLLAGDFNADGGYFSDEREWPNSELQPDWAGYTQLTHNSMDTTVAKNDNTYDRIIVDEALGNMSERASVYYLENIDMTGVFQEGCSMGYVSSSLCQQEGLAGAAWQEFPLSAKTELVSEISDHHPVEVCLGPEAQSRDLVPREGPEAKPRDLSIEGSVTQSHEIAPRKGPWSSLWSRVRSGAAPVRQACLWAFSLALGVSLMNA